MNLKHCTYKMYTLPIWVVTPFARFTISVAPQKILHMRCVINFLYFEALRSRDAIMQSDGIFTMSHLGFTCSQQVQWFFHIYLYAPSQLLQDTVRKPIRFLSRRTDN